MKRLIVAFTLLFVAHGLAQTAADQIAAGRTALAAHDLATAQTCFQAALTLDPTNQTAGVLLGGTQLVALSLQTSTQTLLDGAGVSAAGRDVYGWTADFTRNLSGDPAFPAAFNVSDVTGYWHNTLVPECEIARANLALVTDPSFLLTLSAAETDSPAAVTIDYGDVLMSRAALRSVEFALHFLQGQNLNVNPESIRELAQGNLLTLQRLLNDYPDLLKAGTAGERAAARAALLDLVQTYEAASTFIRNRPAGVQRLFILDSKNVAEEAAFRATLDKAVQSLNAFVQFNLQAPLMCSAPLFSDTWSIRSLLPAITNGTFDPFAMPDPTMGGFFSGLPPEFLTKGLSKLAQPDLGWQWLNPTPLGITYTGYAYGNGVHVAVGSLGNYYTSTDGVNWAHGAIPGNPVLNSVIYAGGQFVAVGMGCTYYSTDGSTWTSGNGVNNSSNYYGLAYGAGRYVALGNNGALATSSDGMSWASSYCGYGDNYRSVVYGSGKFVAVGGSRVISSSTGLSWSSVTTVSGTLNSVATDGTKFVVVGSGNLLVTCTDGTTWNSGTVVAGASPVPSFSGVAYRGGLFVAAGSKTVNNGSVCALASSSDGLTWSALTTSQIGSLNSVNAGPDGFYALGSGGLVLRSTDGATFAIPTGYSYQNVATVFGGLNGLQSFGGKLYAFGNGGSMLVSSDGTTFTPVATGTTFNLNGGFNQGGTAFVVGQNGTILSSTDGTTWGVGASGTTSNLVAISYCNGSYLAVGGGGTIVTSVNGTTWAVRSSGVTSVPVPGGTATGTITLYGVAYGNGVYVAVGGIVGTGSFLGTNVPVVFTSTDGIAWSPTSFTSTWATVLRGVVFRDGKFTAVGTNGTILRSSDGMQWNSASDTGGWSNDFLSIGVLDDGRYWVTVAPSSTSGQASPPTEVLVSSSGDSWFSCTLPAAMSANATQFFQGHVYVCGGNTSLLRTSVAIPAVAAPSVFQAPATQAAPAGSSVTLAAGVTGEGALAYQWQKNGVNISGATGPTLTLNNVQSGDTASYTVIVSNEASSTASGAGTLTVTPQAPVITVEPASRSVPQNLSAVFQVSATGTTPFTYQWMKDSAILTDGGRISGSTSATLTITGVQPADIGSYSVVVTNSVSSTPSNPAALTISPADPVFSTQLTPWASDQSPGRTISDGNGHIYFSWTIYDHSFDVVGGKFAGPLVRVSEATGAFDPTFRMDRRYQEVNFVAPQADGKPVLAVDNGDVATLIRVDSTGAVDSSFNAPLFARPIRFITIQPDGRVLITTDSVTSANPPIGALSLDSAGVFRLNPDGTLDSTFTPAMIDSGDTFFAPPVLDGSGRVYVVGSFVSVNGTARLGIARLSSTGALDTAYASPATMPAGAAYWRVRGFGFQSNGKAVAIGRMTYPSRGSSSDPVVAIRLNTDGSFDNTFTCPLRSSLGLGASGLYLRAMLMQSGDQFVGVSDRLVRFNADGSVDSTFTTCAFDREAYWVSQGSDGRLYVPGVGTVAGTGGPIQLWNNGVAAFSSGGVPDTSFQTAGWGRSAFPTSATVLGDGRVWIAGDFNRFAGINLPGIAQFMPSGALSSTQAAPSGPDDFLSLPSATLADAGNDQVFVNWGVDVEDTGGGFAQLSRLNADGSIDSGFSPQLPNNYPLGAAAMTAAPNGAVILALASVPPEEAVFGNLSDSLLRLRTDGSRDSGIPSLPNLASVNRDSNNHITNINVGGVQVLQALADGRMLVAESGIDGNVRIGRLLAGGAIDTSFQNLSFGTVAPYWGYTNTLTDPATGQQDQFPVTYYAGYTALVTSAVQLSDGRVYVGGRFNLSGSPCGLLRLNADGSLDSTFAGAGIANVDDTAAAPFVSSLVVDAAGRLYVAGRFDHFNGTAVRGLFRLNADGTLDAGWAPGSAVLDYASSDVRLLVAGGKVYAFGDVGAPTDSFPGFYRVLDTASAFTTQPSDQAVVSGTTVSFTAAVTISAPVMQWMLSTDGGYTWTNLTDSGPYSGTATGTLTITGATAAMNGYQYQCLASNSVQNNVASGIATLTVVVTNTSITSASQVVGPEQVPYQILVNSNADWTASVNATWVTLSQTSGSQDGNILVTATANTTGADRTATITVNGVIHTLTQRGAAIQELWGFGLDSSGQLGDNALIQSSHPSELASDVATMAGGDSFSLIVKTDGSLWAVGHNGNGQLGDGTTTDRYTPVQILSGGVQSVAAGGDFSLIVKTDGSLWAMGFNGDGELGDGTTTDRHSPVKILSGGVQAVAAAYDQGVILKTDGSLWAMGAGFPDSPRQLLSGVQAISAGGWYQILILKTDGSLWSWGWDNTPVEILSGGVQAVSQGWFHSLILKIDGSLWAMGSNSQGQLGDGTTTDRSTPVEILSGGVRAISGGGAHSLILKTDGSLWVCGDNRCGQLGDGTTTQRNSLVEILSDGVQAVAAEGWMNSLFLKTDGTLWAAGANEHSQLGKRTTLQRPSPVQVLSGGMDALSAGSAHSLLLMPDGSLEAMGDNNGGELGDGTGRMTRSSPEQILSEGIQAVGAGNTFSLIVKTDGSLWAMGANGNGQLGDGTTNQQNAPEEILTAGVQSVAAGNIHSLVVKTDGSLWAMGDNSNGELGDGTTTQQNAPEEILTAGVQSVAAGTNFSLIVKSDGSLWAMGNNANGQLGDGTTNQQNAPEEILTGGVQSVAAGANHSLILKTDGSLWAMGQNSSGQLGDGTMTDSHSPEQILPSGVWAIAAGQSHSLILKTDGTLWAMGDNTYGQLGDGTTIGHLTPELVAVNVQKIAAGSYHSLFVATGNATPSAPSLTTEPVAEAVTAGGATTFTVAASGNPAPAYQWQASIDGGSTWSNLTETAMYSGTATGTLTIAAATTAMNGFQYRCVATNAVGTAATSNVVALTVSRSVAAQADFNGDGQSDLVWQNLKTGERKIALMNGTTTSSEVSLGVFDVAWQIVGTGDFNGDGQTDTLWENTSTGEYAVYLMNGTTPINWVSLGTTSKDWQIAGVGDFNGDGQPDILWQNTTTGERGLYLMNGTTPTTWISLGTFSTAWQIVGTGDFNGDGQTDTLWQNTGTGEYAVYLMNGTTFTDWISLGTVPTAWQIAGVGDFNGDGKPDILWQNTSTGGRGVYLMNGTAVISWVSLETVSTDWSLMANRAKAHAKSTPDDFNGDGQSDLLWQNTATGERGVYLMNGTTPTTWVSLGTFSTSWQIVGTGDFNGDGKLDSLWQNAATGEYALYCMNGTAFTDWISLGTVSTAWQIVGVADFDGDGQPDILWQNTSTGERGLYLMNGTVQTTWISLGVFSTAWQIVGVGDFNGDGQMDTLWQNTATGEYAVYCMNGTTFTDWISLGTVPTAWQIAGVGDFNGDGQPDILWQNTVTGDRGVYLMNGITVSSWVSLGNFTLDWSMKN